MRGRFCIVSGPSGCGKSTLIRRLMKDCPDFRFPVSATTRAPRAGEADGREYHFLSLTQFEEKIKAGEFLEHALVYGNRYGTLKKTVMDAMGRGEKLIKDVDVQGACSIMAEVPAADLVSVFISPPSMAELRKRLSGRNSEDEAAMARRLEAAEREMQGAREFMHRIVNEDLDQAYAEFRGILESVARI